MTEAHLRLRPPTAVREIAARLEEAGYETWAVGGAVRDSVLGLEVGDWDLTSRATPKQVRRLFRRTVPIGIEHGTVGVIGHDGVLYEVTTFRRDVETFGRHAVVAFADTVEEDLSRRDFTCNALAWHPLTGELRDPFMGLEDLRRGRLRTVGTPSERFAEDYLRVLRALRFAGHFELEIDPPTWDALVAATPRLVDLSAERVREELWKILGKTRRASAALSLYAAAGALAVLYPELDATVGLVRGRGAEIDVWTESLLAVDRVPPSRTLLRVAALMHGVGMATGSGEASGGTRDTGRDEVGARRAGQMMRRLKASNADTERVERLVRHHADFFAPDSSDAGVRRWLRSVGPDLVRDLFRLHFALWRARPATATLRPDDLLARWRTAHHTLLQHPPLDVKALAIDGQDLKTIGLKPGPEFGRILRTLLERVVEEPDLNSRETLLELARRELGA